MREATRRNTSIDCPRGHAAKGWACKPAGLPRLPDHVCGARHRRAHAGGKPVEASYKTGAAPKEKPASIHQRIAQLLRGGRTA